MNQDVGDHGVVVVVGRSAAGLCSDITTGLVQRGFIVVEVRDAPLASRASALNDPCALIAFADPLGECMPEQCQQFHLANRVPIMVFASPGTDVAAWSAVDVELIEAPHDIDAVAYRLDELARTQRQPPARPEAAIQGPNGLLVDPTGRRAFVGNQELSVTRLEFDLLEHLLTRRGEVVSADDLARHVWGYQGGGSRNYIETRVSRLRAKLRAAGLTHVVENLRAVGYVIR